MAAMDLTGRVLIAMPALSDPRFARSVVLICRHGPAGAMGLIVNKPLPEIGFAALLGQLQITPAEHGRMVGVHFGGPVETGRGFVVHSLDWRDEEATLEVALAGDGALGLSGTVGILRALASGGGPRGVLMALGYAGWAADQLEGEIARSDWLVADAPARLIFETPAANRWSEALALLGVDPLGLSSTAGRA
jgi:putative transcriptional regulator